MDETKLGHARYTKNGCGYDPNLGTELPRGTNVMYHPVYWNISRGRAEEVAKEHGANLVWEPAS